MTDTELEPVLAAYTLVPSELTARKVGLVPTVTVVETVFVPTLITDTEPAPAFATYTFVPSGVIIRCCGFRPTAMVATTMFDGMSTTETVFEPGLAMYASPGVAHKLLEPHTPDRHTMLPLDCVQGPSPLA